MTQDRWQAADGPLLPLREVERVPMPDPQPLPDEQRARRRNWWWQVFNEDSRGKKWALKSFSEPVDTSEPLPTCAARVVVLDQANEEFMQIILDDPVYLRRVVERTGAGSITEAELDALAVTLRRWPSLASVGVEDLGPDTGVIVAGLSARGLPAMPVLPDMVSLSAYYPEDDDEDDDDEDDDDEDEDDEYDDDEPSGWSLGMKHRGYFAPALERHFGEDVAGLAEFASRIAGQDEVEVSAPPEQEALLGVALDSAGVRWRGTREVKPLPYRGDAATSAGLTMQLTISGVGWIDLTLTVDGKSYTVPGSAALDDPFTAFVSAVRKAVALNRATYCGWFEEPDYTHIVLVPEQHGDQIHLELWYDDEEDMTTARTGELRAHWVGPTRALAQVAYDAAQSVIGASGSRGVSDKWGCSPPYAELELLDAWLVDPASA